MQSNNHKYLSPDDTDRFLIFLQTHLMQIDLLTNPEFQKTYRLTSQKVIDGIAKSNAEFYREFEHLFMIPKKEMAKIVYDKFGVKLPEMMKNRYMKKKLF